MSMHFLILSLELLSLIILFFLLFVKINGLSLSAFEEQQLLLLARIENMSSGLKIKNPLKKLTSGPGQKTSSM